MKLTTTCERLIMDAAAKVYTAQNINAVFSLMNSNIGHEFDNSVIPMLIEIGFMDKLVEKKVRFELEQCNAVGEQEDFLTFLAETDAKEWWNFFPRDGAVRALSVAIWVGDDVAKAPIPAETTVLCDWYAYPV